MAFSVQDVRSFKFGEGNPVALSKYGTNYLETCKTMKNCVVNVDGSVQVRSGLQNVHILPDNTEIEDMEFLKDDLGERYIIYLSKGNKIYWSNLDGNAMVARTLYGPLDFSYKAGINGPENHGLDKIHKDRGKIIKIKNIKGRVFVFFEKSFPFRIQIEDNEERSRNEPTARPFYYDEADPDWLNVFKYFPCSFNKEFKLDLGKLKITNVVWDKERDENNMPVEDTYGETGECKISFPDRDDLDVSALIGHPIHFSIRNEGNDDIRLVSENPKEWGGAFLGYSKSMTYPSVEDLIENRENADNPVINQVESFKFENSVDLPADPPVSADTPSFQRGYTFFYGLCSPTVLYGILDSAPSVLKKFTYSGGSWSVRDLFDLNDNNLDANYGARLGSVGRILDVFYEGGGYFYLSCFSFFIFPRKSTGGQIHSGPREAYRPPQSRAERDRRVAEDRKFYRNKPFLTGRTPTSNTRGRRRSFFRVNSRGIIDRWYPNVSDFHTSIKNNDIFTYYEGVSGETSFPLNYLDMARVKLSEGYAEVENKGQVKRNETREERASILKLNIKRPTRYLSNPKFKFRRVGTGSTITGYYASYTNKLYKTNASGQIVKVGVKPTSGEDDRPSYIFQLDKYITSMDDNNVYNVNKADGKLYWQPIPDASLDANKDKTVDGIRDATTTTEEEENERERAQEQRIEQAEQALLGVSAKTVFASIGFRFFTVFPYEVEGANTATPKLKCKIYAIGFKTQDTFKNSGLGGAFLDGGEDITDHYVISDWYEPDNSGFPQDGSNVGGKDFFITGGGKLSYSKANQFNEFGNPIKTLFATGGHDYFIEQVKYVDILPVDFPLEFRTTALDNLLQNVARGDDSIPFTLSDPFTYLVRGVDSEKVKFFNFVISEIGAFAQAGAQSVGLTDKGVFYWGINSRQDGRTSSFVNIGKVSKFLASPRFTAIVEVLDRLYVTDRFGDLYVVIYNQANRNFVTVPCGTMINCKNMRSGVPYTGNRILGIDSVTKRLHCLNSGRNGEFEGASQWNCRDAEGNDMDFDLVKRFDNEHYILGRMKDKRYLMKVVEGQTFDNVEGREVPFEAEIEASPITTSNKHPMHNFRANRSLVDLFLFTRNLNEVSVGVGDSVQSVRAEGAQGPLPELYRVPVREAVPAGRGLSFKLKSTERGCLCGASAYLSLEEDRG